MPEERFRLIAGLGNPGAKYQSTRHNVGFMVVDRLAEDHGLDLKKNRFDALFGTGRIGGQRVVLAKPMTFMNRVGPAIRNLADYFSVDTPDVLIIHDDIDLLFGRLKIKGKGGDGGHNGVKSLIAAFGTDGFGRIRIGVGRPDPREETSDYVLGRFDAEHKALLDEVISAARDAVETVLSKGMSEAMNLFHGRTISES